MSFCLDSSNSKYILNSFKQSTNYSQLCSKKQTSTDKINNKKIISFPRFPLNKNYSQKSINKLDSIASIKKSIILAPNTFNNSMKILNLPKFKQNTLKKLKLKPLMLSFYKTKYNIQNKNIEKKLVKRNSYKKYLSEDYDKDNLSQISLIATNYKKKNDNILNIVPNEEGFSIQTFDYKRYAILPKKLPNVMKIHNSILMSCINNYYNSVKKESEFNKKSDEDDFITIHGNSKNNENFKKKYRSLSEKNIIENEINKVMQKVYSNCKK